MKPHVVKIVIDTSKGVVYVRYSDGGWTQLPLNQNEIMSIEFKEIVT